MLVGMKSLTLFTFVSPLKLCTIFIFLSVWAGVSILKRSIRLYAPFYSSDIIIASPLGLRTVLGADGEKKREFDFLSSIELLIVDQADVFLMQNWEHLLVGFIFPKVLVSFHLNFRF